MPKYKVNLLAILTASAEVEVEAETPEAAVAAAIKKHRDDRHGIQVEWYSERGAELDSGAVLDLTDVRGDARALPELIEPENEED